MNEQYIKKLMANMKCGVCGQKYLATNIDILGHQEDLWFLSIFCPHCNSRGLIAATVDKEAELEIVTDLKPRERRKFSRKASVSDDDVLEMHKFLKKFDGDFIGLLAKK